MANGQKALIKVIPYWQSHPVQYLVRARYPTARFEDSPTLSLSDLDPERLREQNDADAYAEELRQLDRSELFKLIDEQRNRDKETAREKAQREEQARPFNRPQANADFAYWSRMSYWTIDEAVALSLGRDPNIANWKYIQSIVKISPFAAEFAAKRELAIRAKVMGQLWDSTNPAIFLAWAERMNFDVPGALTDAVRALGHQIADWKTLYDNAATDRDRCVELTNALNSQITDKDQEIASLGLLVNELRQRVNELEPASPPTAKERGLGTRERDSLLKLFIGMAIKGYSFNPKLGRSSVPNEIAGDLGLLGLDMTDDTVRKYLNEAKELLPRD